MYSSFGSKPSCTRDQTDFKEVKEWEVLDALKEMKNGKAPGRSNITVDLLTEGKKPDIDNSTQFMFSAGEVSMEWNIYHSTLQEGECG